MDAPSTKAPTTRLLGGGGVLVVAAVVLANASNYAFQVLTARHLGAAEYGLLAGLMAFVTVIGTSTASLQTAAARTVVGGRSERSAGLRADALLRSSLRVAAVLTVIVAGLSPVVARAFDVGVAPVLMLASYLPAAAVLSIATGRLQGMERFRAMAFVSAALAGSKVAVALVATLLAVRVTPIMAGLVGATVVWAAAALWSSRSAGATSIGVLDGDVRRGFVAFTALWVLVSMDVPVARGLLPADEAGLYAAAAVLGKGVLWIPSVISLLAFPRVASTVNANESTGPLMVRAFWLTLGLCAVGVIGLLLGGSLVYSLLYGEEFSGAASLAWKIGIATTPLAVVNLLVHHHLAREKARFLWFMVIAVGVQAVAMVMAPASGTWLAAVTGLVALVLATLLVPPGGWRWSGVTRHRALSRLGAV